MGIYARLFAYFNVKSPTEPTLELLRRLCIFSLPICEQLKAESLQRGLFLAVTGLQMV